jgi:hypothetical protein
VVIKNFPVGGTLEELKYSQLFFPVNGHLTIYDIQNKTLKELPGAYLEEYVQSNAIWSPNSKWMVFVSKVYGPYTDLFLTHIDDKGNSSVPALVEKARVPYTVVNYPEFVNSRPVKKFVMQYDFVEIAHIFRAAKAGYYEQAKELFYKYEKQDPFLFKQDCEDMALLLRIIGLPEEAEKYDELAKVTIDTEVFK